MKSFANEWLHIGARILEDQLEDLALTFHEAGVHWCPRPIIAKCELKPQILLAERERFNKVYGKRSR